MKLKYRVFNGGHLSHYLGPNFVFLFASPTWGFADLPYANLNSRSVDDVILSRGIDLLSFRLRLDTDLYNLPFKEKLYTTNQQKLRKKVCVEF